MYYHCRCWSKNTASLCAYPRTDLFGVQFYGVLDNSCDVYCSPHQREYCKEKYEILDGFLPYWARIWKEADAFCLLGNQTFFVSTLLFLLWAQSIFLSMKSLLLELLRWILFMPKFLHFLPWYFIKITFNLMRKLNSLKIILGNLKIKSLKKKMNTLLAHYPW